MHAMNAKMKSVALGLAIALVGTTAAVTPTPAHAIRVSEGHNCGSDGTEYFNDGNVTYWYTTQYCSSLMSR